MTIDERASKSAADRHPMFTVFTPTFNRARTLPRLYESLKRQSVQDFEWVVIDDGSTDDTPDLVAGFIAENALAVRYIAQENAGKHVCANLAAQLARGTYLATLDSDDWYVPTALQTFAESWGSIPPDRLPSFSGVVALCATPAGAIIGDSFPADVLDTTWLEASERYVLGGDKAGCGRVEVDREFPFPVIDGETLVMEAIVYRRMSRKFLLRCINRVVKIVEYQPDGLTAGMSALLAENPQTTRLFYREALQDREFARRGEVARHAANLVRYSLHAGLGLKAIRSELPRPYQAVGLAVGSALYLRDRTRRRLAGPSLH
jgi:glycosyltransferase involved in cell wall biosynthesis